MRNPTKKQVQKVLDNFAKVLPAAKKLDRQTFLGSLDMSNGMAYRDCGTPMCHGGWYAVAAVSKSRLAPDYRDGASQMAEHLGFKSRHELEEWACANPKLWGNNLGSIMFGDVEAFGFSLDDKMKQTLSAVVSHWKKVQKRLPR